MSASRRRLSIVVADDNFVVARCIAYLLRREGHACVTVADGRAALDAVVETRPDLLVLDLDMPKLSGPDVCRRIRANPATRGTRVVVLTGQGQHSLTDWRHVVDADEFMLKPLDPRALVAVVEAMCSGASTESDVPELAGV